MGCVEIDVNDPIRCSNPDCKNGRNIHNDGLKEELYRVRFNAKQYETPMASIQFCCSCYVEETGEILDSFNMTCKRCGKKVKGMDLAGALNVYAGKDALPVVLDKYNLFICGKCLGFEINWLTIPHCVFCNDFIDLNIGIHHRSYLKVVLTTKQHQEFHSSLPEELRTLNLCVSCFHEFVELKFGKL